MNRIKRYTMLVLVSLGTWTCSPPELGPGTISVDRLRINEFQVIGSHNSYRLRTHPQILDSLMTIADNLPENPMELDYNHVTLFTQLEQYGIRQFELDIFHDPEGGRFYNQMGLDFILGQDPASGVDELLEPGLKLLHIPDIDYRTHHYTFKGALWQIKSWSDAHPDHFPIMILVEAKTTSLLDNLPWLDATETLPFDAAALDGIDQEILEVFNEDDLILPEYVRGDHNTLNEAITSEGWPLLGDARGKVMFCFNNGGTDAELYMSGHPNLDGRVMFAQADPGADESAFLMFNESSDDFSSLVQQGYMIRTRSDVGTWEARSGDYTRANLAFSSGAQWISTDYYRPDPRHIDEAGWTDFMVTFNGKSVRVNRQLVQLDVAGAIE